MTDLLERYTVEERVCSSLDRDNGIARRWMVSPRLGGQSRLVALWKPGPGRFSGPPQYLCSCGLEGCAHREAVLATLPTDVPPLVA